MHQMKQFDVLVTMLNIAECIHCEQTAIYQFAHSFEE